MLIAIVNQQMGKPVGFRAPGALCLSAGLRDITTDNNGAYFAHVGWDACTGLGSPNGVALLAALKG